MHPLSLILLAGSLFITSTSQAAKRAAPDTPSTQSSIKKKPLNPTILTWLTQKMYPITSKKRASSEKQFIWNTDWKKIHDCLCTPMPSEETTLQYPKVTCGPYCTLDHIMTEIMKKTSVYDPSDNLYAFRFSKDKKFIALTINYDHLVVIDLEDKTMLILHIPDQAFNLKFSDDNKQISFVTTEDTAFKHQALLTTAPKGDSSVVFKKTCAYTDHTIDIESFVSKTINLETYCFKNMDINDALLLTALIEAEEQQSVLDLGDADNADLKLAYNDLPDEIKESVKDFVEL